MYEDSVVWLCIVWHCPDSSFNVANQCGARTAEVF
ncbi:hypothetical protein CDUR_02345 [Corynebacterium durum]|nr:hypothetical protein [Corynebacterium durum]WJY84225.1 hypothetical protein CDUR_02345 [Corynebacterium durum]